MSKDQIPMASVEFLPIGGILPFTSADDVPPEFQVMDGTVVSYHDAPEFVIRMNKRWAKHSDLLAHQAAVEFWEKHGGSVQQDSVKLPNIPSDQVTELAFGVTYLPEEVKPVLAIKVWRPVSSDGTSQMDDPDPDAR